MSRAVILLALIVAATPPSIGSGQGLVGKWRYDLEGVPTYFIFSDCGVLEIQVPGTGVELAYRVTAIGPPMKVEVCPPEGKDGRCSTISVYLLGESLQIIPDTDLPRSSPALLTDMLMQRVTDDYGVAHCETKPDGSSHAK